MELSSHPSPISHQESLTLRNREPGLIREPARQVAPGGASVGRARSPVESRDPARVSAGDREGIRSVDQADQNRVTRYPMDLPRLEERRYPMELPVVSDRR